MLNLGFIGTGNMGGALAKAAAARADNRIMLANRSRGKAEALAERLGAAVSDSFTVANSADYVFIGVKPQNIGELFDSIRAPLLGRTSRFVLVSMVAGVPIQRVQQLSGGAFPVIRILPNTPVAVGAGTVLYACSPEVSDEERRRFLEAMEGAGSFLELGEGLMDAGSAISGCGPAFAYMFMEALADGGVACGLPRAKALMLSAQMLAGSAKLYLDGGKHPGELKDAVCSPGGSTIQGVRALEQGAFRSAVMEAVIAAYEKEF